MHFECPPTQNVTNKLGFRRHSTKTTLELLDQILVYKIKHFWNKVRDNIFTQLVPVPSACQRLRNEKADCGWLLSAGAELELDKARTLSCWPTGLPSSSPSPLTTLSGSLRHCALPLVTSSMPLKRNSLLVQGRCSSSSTGAEALQSASTSADLWPALLCPDWFPDSSLSGWQSFACSPRNSPSAAVTWLTGHDGRLCAGKSTDASWDGGWLLSGSSLWVCEDPPPAMRASNCRKILWEETRK